MDDEQARYRRWYRKLLGFYPRSHRERFAESMEQTFTDLFRERTRARGRGIVPFVLWIFVETGVGIVRERVTNLVRSVVARNDLFKIIKYAAVILGGLMVAGVVTLMVLARGTGEDIAGIVAPALLITLLSVVAAVVAAILQSASERRRRRASNDR